MRPTEFLHPEQRLAGKAYLVNKLRKFVMTLSTLWQYFNHKKENKEDYTSKFLLIAGEKNVIYDRLKRDFKDEKIFKELPFILPEWREEFDLKVILKEEPIHITSEAVLFLSNIQQLEKRVLCYYNRLIMALGMQNSAVRNVQR